MSERWDDVDRAKGLAILLVVFGHLVARGEPAGLTWYEPLRAAVYSFHMPFFMYLSGLAAGWGSGPSGNGSGPGGHARWLARRARRLLLPFVAFGLLILAGKLAAGGWLAVDHAPAGLRDGLAALFWRTGDSPATSVWYLLVLFVYVAVLPRVLRVGGPVAAWGIALGLYAWQAPAIAYLDRIAGYAVFFVAGLVAARSAAWRGTVDRWRGPALGGLLFALALIVAGVLPGGRLDAPGARAVLLGVGVLSMPALHALVRTALVRRARLLLTLGRASYAIYLLNTILLGLAKALLLVVLPWDARAFPIFALVMMLAGTLGPIALARGLAWWRSIGGATAGTAAPPQSPGDALPAP